MPPAAIIGVETAARMLGTRSKVGIVLFSNEPAKVPRLGARFGALRDDGVHARCGESLSFFYCGGCADDEDAARFEAGQGVGVGGCRR